MRRTRQKLVAKTLEVVDKQYLKDLEEYKGGLIAGEKFKRNGIIKLAKDLEEAGFRPLHKISTKIRTDLKPIIDMGIFDPDYIPRVLDKKFKNLVKSHKSESSGGKLQQKSDTENDETQRSPQSIDEEQEHDETLDRRLSTWIDISEDLTGLKQDKQSSDNLELVEQTGKHRFNAIKKMSDDEVKTEYSFARKVALLLNDWMKRLDDELDVRKKKEGMTGA